MAYGAAAEGKSPELRCPHGDTIPAAPIRRGAELFLAYDVGPAGAMVVIFGAPECAHAHDRAHVREAVSTFKTSPVLRGPAYTAHAR